MPEEKFDPVKEFITLRDNLSKAVGQSLRNVAATSFPAVDIYETERQLVIYTEPLLGADPSSIEVSVEDNVLFLSGTTHPHVDIPDTAFLQRELIHGPFSRAIPLPRQVKAAEASASFKNDILTVTLPKEEPKNSQIVDVTPAE